MLSSQKKPRVLATAPTETCGSSWRAVKANNLWAVKFTKVKGHATDKMVHKATSRQKTNYVTMKPTQLRTRVST